MRASPLVLACFWIALAAGAARAEPPEAAEALSRRCTESVEQRRFREALDVCAKAEAARHAPVHLLHLARAHEALGHAAEAAAVRARAAPDTGAQRRLDVTVESRLGRPAPAVAVSRLVHTGLPPDLALPHVRACVDPASEPGDRLELQVHVSPSGVLSRVALDVVRSRGAADARGGFTPAALACIRRALGEIRVDLVAGAPPVMLRGTYVITRHAGQVVVVGRARAVSP